MVYSAMGARVHDRDEQLSGDVVKAALSDAGLDPGLLDRALSDESTTEDVCVDHEAVVERVGAFGVPTIVLASGKGIFGPVVSRAPGGDEARQLWEHVRWLIEHDRFFELKRSRDREPGS